MDRIPAYTPDFSHSSRRGNMAGKLLKYIASNTKSFALRLSVMIVAFILCSVTLPLQIQESQRVTNLEIGVRQLWENPPSLGWYPSSAPRYDWEPPLKVSNGYVLVRCNGGLIQTSSAVSSAVVAARIMNATLVIPEFDTTSYWHDDRCFEIFTPEEQAILRKYRRENYSDKDLEYSARRRIGKCPLTPEEVGLFLRAMGLDNHTRLYIVVSNFFGGDRLMQPFRDLFPRLINHSAIMTPKELEVINGERRGLWGSAIDYLVCLQADIFMPTYDGPSNFANNLMGHRLYNGFKTTIQPNRKALTPIFMDREAGITENFEARIRTAMLKMPIGSPHPRIPSQSFYANPWPECFCKPFPDSPEDQCPHPTLNGGLELERNAQNDED